MADKDPTKSKGKETEPLRIIKSTTDLQRLKLEKLMKNPEKPVIIPERPKMKGLAPTPDFVRNVMGSSAGAGSGEFHVYRHLRRKEYARQKFNQEKNEQEKLDEEYQQKIEENKRIAEEKTAKKRAKRIKKKRHAKLKVKKPKLENKSDNETSDDSRSSSDKERREDGNGDSKEDEKKTESDHTVPSQDNTE